MTCSLRIHKNTEVIYFPFDEERDCIYKSQCDEDLELMDTDDDR